MRTTILLFILFYGGLAIGQSTFNTLYHKPDKGERVLGVYEFNNHYYHYGDIDSAFFLGGFWSGYIDKIDLNGNTTSSNIITISDPEAVVGLVGLSNGKLAGVIREGSNRHTTLIICDKNGKLESSYELIDTFYTYLDNMPFRILNVEDELVIATTHYIDSINSVDAILMKVDTLGNIIWKRNYTEGDNNESIRGLTELQDGGYLLGIHSSFQGFGWRELVIKTDAQGNEVNRFEVLTSDPTRSLKWVEEMKDGNYLLSITTSEVPPTPQTGHIGRATITKTTPSGNIIWESQFGKEDTCYHNTGVVWTSTIETEEVFELENGDIIVFGSGSVICSQLSSPIIIRLDAMGNEIWRKVYETEGNDFLEHGIVTSDGGFLMGVYDHDYNISLNTRLIKTDCDGNLEWTDACSIIESDKDILVYPNPFNNEVTFQVNSGQENISRVIVYNGLGKLVENLIFFNRQLLPINTSNWPTGLYTYRIIVNGVHFGSGKLIKS